LKNQESKRIIRFADLPVKAVFMLLLTVNLVGCSWLSSTPSSTPSTTTTLTPASVKNSTRPYIQAFITSTVHGSPTQVPSSSTTASPSRTNSQSIILTATPSPVPTPNLLEKSNTNWKITFADEFNNSHLDTNKWTSCYWWDNHGCTNPGNRELEWYLPANINVSNHSLNLVAQKQAAHGSDGKTYPYTSGMVTTGRDTESTSQPVKFSFQYGFVEIRAKVPTGKGLWPAFWMLPANNDKLPEIDVMEVVGDRPGTVLMTLHYPTRSGNPDQVQKDWNADVDLSQDWHTYGVDWEPDHISWYVDGVERFRYNDSAQIPHEPMYLLLNLAVGGFWVGYPDQTTRFPNTFTVNYVRVWQSSSGN
jgi:beta-glucanase (GH16 family)